MIQHSYLQPSDNVAQYVADSLNRQEVSKEFAETIAVDHDMQIYAWVSDEANEYGMDPWRLIDGPEDAPKARYFVSGKSLEKAGIEKPKNAVKSFAERWADMCINNGA